MQLLCTDGQRTSIMAKQGCHSAAADGSGTRVDLTLREFEWDCIEQALYKCSIEAVQVVSFNQNVTSSSISQTHVIIF